MAKRITFPGCTWPGRAIASSTFFQSESGEGWAADHVQDKKLTVIRNRKIFPSRIWRCINLISNLAADDRIGCRACLLDLSILYGGVVLEKKVCDAARRYIRCRR